MDYSRLTKVAAPALFLAAAAGLSLLFRKKPVLTLIQTFTQGGKSVSLLQGDPALSVCDVLVIPNSPKLAFESSLSQCVLKGAGPVLERECRSWVQRFGELIPGECAVTSGGSLAVRHIVHVVPPQSTDLSILELALRNALEVATGLGTSSIGITEVGWRRDISEKDYTATLATVIAGALHSACTHNVQVIIRCSRLHAALSEALAHWFSP